VPILSRFEASPVVTDRCLGCGAGLPCAAVHLLHRDGVLAVRSPYCAACEGSRA
jgi:hypothetical protein